MKKISILIMVLAMMLSMVACGDDAEKSGEKDNSVMQENPKPESSMAESAESTEDTITEDANESDVSDISDVQASDKFIVAEDETSKDATIELNYRKPADVALGFVQALATNEYSVVISALDINNSPFVFAEDIIFGLPRSNYSDIVEYGGDEVYLSVKKSDVNKSSGFATITIDMMSNEDKVLDSYDVYLVLNTENKWLVKDTSFYLENYYIRTASGVALSIEDVTVEADYRCGESGYNNMMDLYKISAIGKAEKHISISCDKYEASCDEMPVFNTDQEPLGITETLKDEKLNEVLDAVKTLWNSFYTDYVNGASVSDMAKYFDKSVDTEVIKTCCDGFQDLINAPSNFTDKEHHITDIQLRDGETCFYITDDVIVANFQYQLDWIWDFSMGGPESCRRKSHILLKETDDGYKIFLVSDIKLFNTSSGKEW